MITLNRKYIKNCDAVASKLEHKGHIVAVINKRDAYYENDLTREFRQNLCPHDWETNAEYEDLAKFIK